MKVLTLATANLHEWLEVSKQWGNSTLPIIACYWYRCLVCLLWVQRNAFHLLSRHTMLPVLWCFPAAGKLKWWDVRMCHCMFFHQVSICSWQMTSQTSITLEPTLGVPQCLQYLYTFTKHTLVREGIQTSCLGAVCSATPQCISWTILLAPGEGKSSHKQ